MALLEEIVEIYGFTPDEVENCLGPSYLAAESEAKQQYEQTRERVLRRYETIAEAIGINE